MATDSVPSQEQWQLAYTWVKQHEFRSTHGDPVFEATAEAYAHGLANAQSQIDRLQKENESLSKDRDRFVKEYTQQWSIAENAKTRELELRARVVKGLRAIRKVLKGGSRG